MKPIIKLNSSAIRRSACMRRLDYTLQGYREVVVGNDIVFGTCFHDFVAEYRRNGQNVTAAVAVGWAARDREPAIYTKKFKEHLDDPTYFHSICVLWAMEHSEWQTVMLGNEPATELPWLIPFYEGTHVDIVLCGTIDDICVHRTNPGVIAVRDYKTTSNSDPDKFFEKYRMSTQLMFYYLGMTKVCEQALVDQPNSELAALWLDAKSRCVMIEALFLDKQPFKTVFRTSTPLDVSAAQLAEFEKLVYGVCKKLDVPPGYEHPREGLVNAACEGDYGRKCLFFDACAAPSKEDSDLYLRTQFVKETYDPLSV